jgi:hypothetical protein
MEYACEVDPSVRREPGRAPHAGVGEEEVERGEVGRVGGERRRGVRAGRGEEPQLSGDEAEQGVERGLRAAPRPREL